MDSIIIRPATPEDLQDGINFYNHVIEALADTGFIKWTVGVYPTMEDLAAAVDSHSLYLAFGGERVVGAFVMNRLQGEGYQETAWQRNRSSRGAGLDTGSSRKRRGSRPSVAMR